MTEGVIVARRCACRGWIVGSERADEETAEAVMEHQKEEPHRSWDSEEWQEANTAPVAVRVTVRRVA